VGELGFASVGVGFASVRGWVSNCESVGSRVCEGVCARGLQNEQVPFRSFILATIYLLPYILQVRP